MRKAQEAPAYDQEYTLLLQGYDISIVPSDLGEDYFYVTLYENGAEVFEQDIPIPVMQPNDTNDDNINNIAQTAIDFYEAERGALGEGAGAMEASVKKQSFLYDMWEFEGFYSNLKNTPYEEMAYSLIENYYSIDVEENEFYKANRESEDELVEVEHDLKMLDLQRMKLAPADTKIIIVQASDKKAWLGDAQDVQAFLDKFVASPLESDAVRLVSHYLDLKEKINKHDEGSESFWDRKDDVRHQMEMLELEALQINVMEKLPQSGLEAFPALGAEVAELMENVSFDEPLEPMMLTATEDSEKEPEKTVVLPELLPVDERIEELGEFHQGLDVAEVVPDEAKLFQVGDEVKLTKELETLGGFNVSQTLPKGTVGVIESLADKSAELYYVRFPEEKAFVQVPSSILSK